MFRKTLFTAAAVLAFVGLAAAPSSAQYEDVEPALAVNKAQVAQGDCYVLTGTDFDANTTYELGVIYQGEAEAEGEGDADVAASALPETETTHNLGTVTTDATGSFTTTQAVEPDAELGTYTIGIDTTITETDEGFSTITTVDYEVVAGDGTSDCPVPVDETTTTTPVTTAPVTTAPVTTVPAGTAGPAGPGVSGGTLARTGSSTMPIVAAGLGLLAAGSGLLLVNRRRRIA